MKIEIPEDCDIPFVELVKFFNKYDYGLSYQDDIIRVVKIEPVNVVKGDEVRVMTNDPIKDDKGSMS